MDGELLRNVPRSSCDSRAMPIEVTRHRGQAIAGRIRNTASSLTIQG